MLFKRILCTAAAPILLLGVVISLSGCASLVSQGALSAPKLNLDILSDDQMASVGYLQQRYCSDSDNHTEQMCLTYSKAPAYDQSGREQWRSQASGWAEQAPLSTSVGEIELNVWPAESVISSPLANQVNNEIEGSDHEIVMPYVMALKTTRVEDRLSMVLDAPVADEVQGTYVLLHGFRTNKESLLFVAEALRYYGYNVILVDLFGHGASDGKFSFSGKPDARAISALLDERDLQTPLHLLGMSMGGTTATHLVEMRNDVHSLTLLAPMLEFVDAFVDAGRAYTRTAHFVPESTLKKGARHALDEAGTPPEDTAVVQRVAELDIPVLIMGSVNDMISPLSKLENLAAEKVTVHAVSPRTHHGMILWDSDDVKYWHQWLLASIHH